MWLQSETDIHANIKKNEEFLFSPTEIYCKKNEKNEKKRKYKAFNDNSKYRKNKKLNISFLCNIPFIIYK